MTVILQQRTMQVSIPGYCQPAGKQCNFKYMVFPFALKIIELQQCHFHLNSLILDSQKPKL